LFVLSFAIPALLVPPPPVPLLIPVVPLVVPGLVALLLAPVGLPGLFI
jgi:hypothetical protein